MKMDEVALPVSDVDDGLRERLDQEIYAFNVPATGGDRGSGLGTQLLVTAEQEMQRRGCDQVVLSTHSFQAPGFYARFGYTECGRTPGNPRGHDQIHPVKQFS